MLKNLVQNLRFKLLMNVLRKVKFYEVARAERVYRSGDLRQMKLDHRPACSRENQNSETSRTKVLLIAQVLIGGDEGIECRLGCAEKVAVFKFGPSHFVGGGNAVTRQQAAQGRRRSLVEENLHGRRGPIQASGGRQTLFGVAQNRLHLFTSHAGEPFEEFIHSSPVFQVLEQRLDWHPCALEDPNAADLSRRPFHGGTMTPIKHGEKICLQTPGGKCVLPGLNADDWRLLTDHAFKTSAPFAASCSN